MNSTAKRILSLVAAAIAIGGAVMLWNSYWRTMASIMPGVNDSSSTSMEPTDLVLRTRFFKGFKLIPENASPLEWRLRLPRSYVVSQIGDTGAVQHEAANCCFVGYHLAVVSDPKSDELLPSVGVPAQVRQREEYIIDITNAGAVPEIAAEDNCITADQFERFMRANGNFVSARDRTCPLARRDAAFSLI